MHKHKDWAIYHNSFEKILIDLKNSKFVNEYILCKALESIYLI